MPHTVPPFDHLPPDPADIRAATATATALSVQPPVNAPLSAAARAFNLQLTRIDKLKRQLEELDTLGQTHRADLLKHVAPLEKRHAQAMREMALFLDQRLAGKGLTAAQRKMAREMVCSLAQALAAGGDAEMAAVHDRHSPQDLAALAREQTQEMRADMEAMFGARFDGLDDSASADEVLRAGMERMRQAAAQEQERRDAAAQKRKARKKPNAKEAAAQAQMDDAETTLRRLYRQLASALHPDREPDAQARLAKTALMSEANAAYGRKDLVALMQIQQRALVADPLAAASLGDERLAALTLLLKQQVAELERERAGRQSQMVAEFELPWGRGVTRQTLQAALVDQMMRLEDDLSQMATDLELVQNDAGLKRWLKQQRALSNEVSRMSEPFDLDFF